MSLFKNRYEEVTDSIICSNCHTHCLRHCYGIQRQRHLRLRIFKGQRIFFKTPFDISILRDYRLIMDYVRRLQCYKKIHQARIDDFFFITGIGFDSGDRTGDRRRKALVQIFHF